MIRTVAAVWTLSVITTAMIAGATVSGRKPSIAAASTAINLSLILAVLALWGVLG